MTHPITIAARKDKAAFADSIGINEGFISDLVDQFYARVRQDAEIGPIFARHISDWEPHLTRMKDFWSSVAIESGRFKGNPMVKHMAITGLGEKHFHRWMTLFQETLADIAPSEKAAEFLSQKAAMIGASLQAGIEARKLRSTSRKISEGV